VKSHRYGQVIHTLAFSLFVLCITHQCGGLVIDELGKLIAFLIFAGLILFVVSRSSVWRKAIASSSISFVRFFCTPTFRRRFIRRSHAVVVASNTLVLPFRFQLPPPFLAR